MASIYSNNILCVFHLFDLASVTAAAVAAADSLFMFHCSTYEGLSWMHKCTVIFITSLIIVCKH